MRRCLQAAILLERSLTPLCFSVLRIFRHNKDKYFRLDPPFVGDLPSNSISKDNLSQLTAISESWLDEHEQRDKFVEIASVLGDRE